jgi:hypothetical protein
MIASLPALIARQGAPESIPGCAIPQRHTAQAAADRTLAERSTDNANSNDADVTEMAPTTRNSVIFPPYWMSIFLRVDSVLVSVFQRKFAAGISIGHERTLRRERR